MELSSSSAATLTRPRLTLTVLAVAAVVSIGGSLVYDAYFSSPEPSGSLHRSNAVRVSRRRDRPRRRESNASTASSSESHGDENADRGAAAQHNDDAESQTVAQDPGDGWWEDPWQSVPQRAGQNIVSLLFRVSEDNARRNAYVHRGCACNACGIVPIRGIRYRCANCADFDLCETCESQGLHIKTHVFYKVKIPAPPFGPRQMQTVWYPGDPDSCVKNLPRSLMIKLSKETGFERPELEAFWEQWTFMANTEWREDPDDLCIAMDRKTFERCLVPSGGYRHAAPNLIHERMFSFYDTNNDDLIGFTEFLHGLSYRKRKDKLRKIFDGYDVDGDGLVNRRDFLRIFRAYYVLYKQMHKDILEGLDDQVMSSTEAHQLISGRQPLSSLFGREGRVPQADDDRPMEGKVFNSNGDVMLRDETVRAVGDDKPDTAGREEILTGLFTKSGAHVEISTSAEGGSRYWEALLNPPVAVHEIPAFITGDIQVITNINNDADNGEDGDDSTSRTPEEQTGLVDDENNDSPAVPIGANGSDPNGESEPTPQAAVPPFHSQAHRFLRAQMDRRMRSAARSEAKSRSVARRRLHERWKRRQFYLDEEEGASAPPGWDDEEDVLARPNGVGESSKSAFHHTRPNLSRSSSKVRFAEGLGDTDHFDLGSNMSTLSRNLPETWGSIGLPESERDAGKEILYQITQQAFNELLDILFKAKEDLAVRAAETKQARDKNRHLFENLDPSQEHKSRDRVEAEHVESPKLIHVDEKSIREQTLPELLAQSGYTVEEPATNGEPSGDGDTGEGEPSGSDRAVTPDGSNVSSSTNGSKSPSRDVLGEILAAKEQLDDTGFVLVGSEDVTWPQFRPNSEAEAATAVPATPATAVAEGVTIPAPVTKFPPVFDSSASSSAGEPTKRKKKVKTGQANGDRGDGTPTPVSRAMLFEWKRLDMAEKEAQERGGWGKLDYRDFEAIYTGEENAGNRLDYLGSWIDFCIP